MRTAQDQADDARSAVDTARAALGGPEDALNELQTEIGTSQGRYDESRDRHKKLQGEVAQEEENCSDIELLSAIEAALRRRVGTGKRYRAS